MEYKGIFDTHAHYDDEKFNKDRDTVLSSLAEHGVSLVVDPACDLESCEKTLELSEGEFKIIRTIDMTSISEVKNLMFDSHKDLMAVISLLVKNFRLLTDEEILTVKQFL